MTSRATILAKIKNSQPVTTALPHDLEFRYSDVDAIEKFSSVLVSIGGAAIEVAGYTEIANHIIKEFKNAKRIISTLPELADITEADWQRNNPHSYENVDLAIISAHFGVAENSALWITEDLMQQRAVPFICQQLAVVVQQNDILMDMHQAYERIGEADYGFGAFIAGPSKTADIEQSLVLGAHGPKGMTIFIMKS